MEETVTLHEVFVKRGIAPPQLLWCGFIVCSVLESAMACALHLLPKDTDDGKDDDAVAPKLEVRAVNEAKSGSGGNRLCGFSFARAHRSQRRARGGQGRPQTRSQHTSPPRSSPTERASSGSHPRPPKTAPVGYLFGGGSGSRNDSVV